MAPRFWMSVLVAMFQEASSSVGESSPNTLYLAFTKSVFSFEGILVSHVSVFTTSPITPSLPGAGPGSHTGVLPTCSSLTFEFSPPLYPISKTKTCKKNGKGVPRHVERVRNN